MSRQFGGRTGAEQLTSETETRFHPGEFLAELELTRLAGAIHCARFSRCYNPNRFNYSDQFVPLPLAFLHVIR